MQLHNKAYQELPLGSIKPEGWLHEMLMRQRNGMSSQMDTLYPEVMGERNGWLGGDGDQWERGPYWIDGLLPLAYILDDDELKAKVQPWIEWTLASQREDGYFGPATDYLYERGLQRNNSADWWPRMVMLKVLQQYYSATGDSRVVEFLTAYFRYQLQTLPTKPLGHWTSWAEYRACDNLNVVLWLYRITGDEFLLELGELLHAQSFDYTGFFLDGESLNHTATIHGVNLAQGIKELVIYWQLNPQQKYLQAVEKGLADLRHFNGFPNGMFGGDELLHGNNPTQGSELCSAVEMMYSLEEMTKITGNLDYVDLLERIAFNALPTQISDDFMARQYFQQANQVYISRSERNFDINHGQTDLVFGLLTGYPCCTSNLHQGWPKFVQNLWYSTPNGGLAALSYGPSTVESVVGKDVPIKITEQTTYPMGNTIRFTISLARNRKVAFPLSLRIPSWTSAAVITVNGERVECSEPNSVTVIERTWRDDDVVEMELPMSVHTDEWYEKSISVERGPLVYALRIEEEWQCKTFEKLPSIYGTTYWEVYPKSKWNYGLMQVENDNLAEAFEVVVDESKLNSDWYWNLESAPITIKAQAREIPSWTLYNQMAGPQPYGNMTYGFGVGNAAVETVELVPYGCTTLRISEFPVIKK